MLLVFELPNLHLWRKGFKIRNFAGRVCTRVSFVTDLTAPAGVSRVAARSTVATS